MENDMLIHTHVDVRTAGQFHFGQLTGRCQRIGASSELRRHHRAFDQFRRRFAERKGA